MCIVYTADERIPLADNDRGMKNGWRCIPVPPDDSGDWIIADDRSDKKTGWARRGQIRSSVLSH
jgi:hypothetical protein